MHFDVADELAAWEKYMERIRYVDPEHVRAKNGPNFHGREILDKSPAYK